MNKITGGISWSLCGLIDGTRQDEWAVYTEIENSAKNHKSHIKNQIV